MSQNIRKNLFPAIGRIGITYVVVISNDLDTKNIQAKGESRMVELIMEVECAKVN